jgi:hypothetical protein
MGIAAALMAARKDPSVWEKAAWTFMMFGLLLVEVLAIRADRKDHDEQINTLYQTSERNLEITTGKDSIPCIMPQSHAVAANGMLPLVVWDRPEYPNGC